MKGQPRTTRQLARLHPMMAKPETARQHARNALQGLAVLTDEIKTAVELRARMREVFEAVESVRGRILDTLAEIERGNL